MARIPSKNDIKRVIQAVQSQGLPIAGVHVKADGSIDVKTKAVSEATADKALDEWVAKNAHKTEGT